MLWLFIVIITSFCQQSSVNGWTHGSSSHNLPEGSNCNATLGTGICKRIQHCEPYVRREINYADLKRCSFNRTDEITCCPTFLRGSRTSPVISRWQTQTTMQPPRLQIQTTMQPPRWQTQTTMQPSRWESQTTMQPDIDVRDSISEPKHEIRKFRNRHNRKEGSFCRLPSSRAGICKRLSQCEVFLSKEIQYAELTRCSFIGIDEVVCCPPPSAQSLGITLTSRLSQNLTAKRPSQIACDGYKAKVAPKFTFHIIDGDEASPGEYPHIGAMLYESSEAGRQYDVRCTASLISEKFALTAAHCVARELPLLVRFGTIEWDPTINTKYRFDAKVKEVIDHEQYVSSLSYHDIALIEFTENVSFNMLVYPTCLHSTNEDLSPSIDLKVAGWGTTNVATRSMSSNLMSTTVHTVGITYCNETYQKNGLMRQYERGLLEGQYCAVDLSTVTNKDACYGDSGGPLMRHVKETLWDLVGLVSFGNGCGEAIPSVYTRISYYLDWIERNVWPNQSDQ